MSARPSDHVTWAEVHALQEQAETLGLIAHLSSAHGYRYHAALHKAAAARTAYEQRKRHEQEQEQRAAERLAAESSIARIDRERRRLANERRGLIKKVVAAS